jgi:hypothetical protein
MATPVLLAAATGLLLCAVPVLKLLHSRSYNRYREVTALPEVESLRHCCVALGVGVMGAAALAGVAAGLLAYFSLWARIAAELMSLGIGAAALGLLVRWIAKRVAAGNFAEYVRSSPTWWRVVLAFLIPFAVTMAAAGTYRTAADPGLRAALWKALGVPTATADRDAASDSTSGGDGRVQTGSDLSDL